MSWSILEGDCIDVMRTLPAESVDAVITSPPYAMQRKATYGGVPEADYPAWTVAWMTEARRLLKPDGSVVINIRPHVKGGQMSDYVLRTRLALRDDGWAELPEMIWHKPDALPTGSKSRPRRAWESLLWFAHHGRAWADPLAAGAQMHEHSKKYGMGMDAAQRNGWAHGATTKGKTFAQDKARVTDVFRVAAVNSRWEKHPGFDHPAPYPSAVAEQVAHLICPPSGTILDPFSGSASTGVAAIRNGWDYVGIEAMSDYAAASRARLTALEDLPDQIGA